MESDKKYPDAKEMADVYNKHGEEYHNSRREKGRLTNEYIDMPTNLALLPFNLKNLKILDAGCGSGIYSNLLAQRGAIVYGIDISKKMIEIAKRETPENLSINYQVGNLYEMPYKDKIFDVILCSYVLENVEKLEIVMKEFARVLKNNGVVVISCSHPVKQLSEKKIVSGEKILILKDYYDKSERISDFGKGMKVKKYKRNIEDYSKVFKETGFLIEELKEPQPLIKGKEIDLELYEFSMRIPHIIAFKLVKFNK